MGKPTVISLFTGAGGLDLGLHAAGFQTAVAVEMDADCCATLRRNRKYFGEVVERRIEDVASSEILSAARLSVGEADILVGGPPCQPFSKSGYWAHGDAARLKDPRANTLREYLRVLRETKPKTFFLENVSGLAYAGKAEGYQFLVDQIARINQDTGTNYRVSAKVVNAADYGVPQTRERILIVGSRDGRPFEFPAPDFSNPDLTSDRPWRTAWDALGDLADPDEADECRLRGRWAELVPSIPEGWNYLWHTERGGSGIELFGWRRRYWSFLLKLSKRRPSWTLTASPGPAIGPFHWKNRRLARRELLRLQTFPDGYSVVGTLSDVQRQVGNAVPSLLAEVFARKIRADLLDQRVDSTELMLLPPRRAPPRRERVRAVPPKYLSLAGPHSAHPGTGRGFGATRRDADSAPV